MLFLIICDCRNVLTSFFSDFHLVVILPCLALCFPTLQFILWLCIHWKWKKVRMKVTRLYPTLHDPLDCSLPGSPVHGILQARILEWMAIALSRECSLLQGIFPSQESNPGLPHCRRILYHLSHQRSLRILEWEAYPFSRASSQLRSQTGVPCTAGAFLTSWATREAIRRQINTTSRALF